MDIGNTVEKQYTSGPYRISEWAHLTNVVLFSGTEVAEVLANAISASGFPHAKGERGFLILAEMTSKRNMAPGAYTAKCIDTARRFSGAMVGCVATKALTEVSSETMPSQNEDFVVFTPGVNIISKGDGKGQQYNTPKKAVQGGTDFVIVGRGIYAAADPVKAAK